MMPLTEDAKVPLEQSHQESEHLKDKNKNPTSLNPQAEKFLLTMVHSSKIENKFLKRSAESKLESGGSGSGAGGAEAGAFSEPSVKVQRIQLTSAIATTTGTTGKTTESLTKSSVKIVQQVEFTPSAANSEAHQISTNVESNIVQSNAGTIVPTSAGTIKSLVEYKQESENDFDLDQCVAALEKDPCFNSDVGFTCDEAAHDDAFKKILSNISDFHPSFINNLHFEHDVRPPPQQQQEERQQQQQQQAAAAGEAAAGCKNTILGAGGQGGQGNFTNSTPPRPPSGPVARNISQAQQLHMSNPTHENQGIQEKTKSAAMVPLVERIEVEGQQKKKKMKLNPEAKEFLPQSLSSQKLRLEHSEVQMLNPEAKAFVPSSLRVAESTQAKTDSQTSSLQAQEAALERFLGVIDVVEDDMLSASYDDIRFDHQVSIQEAFDKAKALLLEPPDESP